MSEKISIREWIEKFNNGEFDDSSLRTQLAAGWYDWFCSNQSLKKRLNKMGNIIKEIKNDYILDNYYLWFKNNCPINYPLYDDFRFEPFDENKRNQLYFVVSCDHPCGSKYMYEISTARNGYALEFECKNKSQVLKVINKLGTDLPNLLIDHSKDINMEEIQEMEKLEKNLKDIVKVSLKNGLHGNTDKIDKAKKRFITFF